MSERFFDVDEELEQAARLIDSGRSEEALALIETCLRHDPENASGHALKGWALTRLQRLEAADHAVSRTIALDPTLAAGHYVAAQLHLLRGQLQEAAQGLEKAMALDEGTSLPYLMSLAQVRWDLGQSKEALATLDRLTQLEPFDPDVLSIRARFALLQGQLDQAKELAELALKVQPGDPYAEKLLVSVAQEEGDHETVVRLATSMLEKQASDAEAHSLLIEGLLAQDQNADALLAADRFLAAHADNTAALALKAKAFAAAGKLKDARRTIDQAKGLDPKDPFLRLVAGGIEEAGGNVPAAAAAYEEAVRLEPRDIDARIRLIFCYLDRSRQIAARKAIEDLAACTRDDANLLCVAASLAEQAEWEEGVLRFASAALEAEAALPSAHLLLGYAKLRSDDLDAARDHADRALKIDDGFKPAKDLLTAVEDRAEAMKTLQYRVFSRYPGLRDFLITAGIAIAAALFFMAYFYGKLQKLHSTTFPPS